MFMEKDEVWVEILTPEGKTTTLSRNNGHQSLNDLPPHSRPHLHHCKSIKAHTIIHLLQQRESEKVLKNAVLEGKC
jgi:DNA topoisomerase VI subunit B